MPSLALQVVRLTGAVIPQWATGDFWLHYYGRHQYADGRTTFPNVAAQVLLNAALEPERAATFGIDPSIFKDKIVVFGSSAAGTFDLKASPLDDFYPGVEVQATAIENLLESQRVVVVGAGWIALVTAIATVAAGVGAMGAQRTSLKLLASLLVMLVLFAVVVLLFRRPHIVWLPPVAPLMGTIISVVLALSWSYFAEDRQARFFLKALGQYVSPRVAAELKADPEKLSLTTQERELTILFSDIANFTDITEKLKRRVGQLLKLYLAEMSQPVLAQDGTLDKYIGDAIMAFWNAPTLQEDHAVRACRAALAMRRCEERIMPQLVELGGEGMFTRIGINTGDCAFGNLGSPEKFNYSCIGDACNFASRLEGANKLYGTRVLLGESTARLVRGRFVMRKVDVLRVKGKTEPQAVYELIGEGQPDESTTTLVGYYEAALADYCAGKWDAAEKILLDVLTRFPQDGPSRELISRIAHFRDEPPPADWDGVFVAKTK
jgi:adenylate cyclase